MAKKSATKDEPNTTESIAVAKPPSIHLAIESATAKGVELFAGHFTKFRHSPPGITSKRTTPAIFAGANEVVGEIRSAAIGASLGGKVDVDLACEIASGAFDVVAAACKFDAIPSPFCSLVDGPTLRGMVIPALRVALETWNAQVTAPKKPEPEKV